MPQVVVPGLAAYAGALEPTDKNDTGHHGYIRGEITEKGCSFSFVPFALREYIHCQVEVDPRTTGARLREMVQAKIEEKGEQNMYKFLLKDIMTRMFCLTGCTGRERKYHRHPGRDKACMGSGETVPEQ